MRTILLRDVKLEWYNRNIINGIIHFVFIAHKSMFYYDLIVTDRAIYLSLVHAAVGHYFDLNGGNGAGAGSMLPPLPSMTFIRDVTIGEGESVPPLTDFTKTWTVMNTGNEPWPEGKYSIKIQIFTDVLNLNQEFTVNFNLCTYRLYIKIHTGKPYVRW